MTSKRIGKPSLNKTSNKTSFKNSLASSKKSDKKMLQQPQQTQQKNQQPVIPFSVYDKILLVGEGDFSFAASLVLDHGVSDLLPTCYDSKEEVLSKYPTTASSHIASINEAFPADSSKSKGYKKPIGPVLYSVDATKLDKNKDLRQHGPFTRIFFNFPHTGGISTDVNRQVRYNQALLATFFQVCPSLLASTSSDVEEPDGSAIPPPSILVTIFEGEPYTLWNIRDLARSAGLMVERSFRFPAEVYPTYKHARTIGMIKKGGEDGQEQSESAWKGEGRPARMYEFRVKDEFNSVPVMKRKKRRGGEESSSEEDER